MQTGSLNEALDNNYVPEKKQAKKVYKCDDYDDVSYYPDEDHEGHDHEPDGYCIEADEYIQDMM